MMLYDYENKYYDYENGTIDDDHIRRTFRCDFISVIDYYDIPDYGLRGRYKYIPINSSICILALYVVIVVIVIFYSTYCN